MIVKPITFDALFSAVAWDDMIDEYTQECANLSLSSGGQVDKERYYTLERAGVMHVLGAYEGDDLIGFATILITPVPHFSKTVGVTESLFLQKSRRYGGRGVRLIREVKRFVKRLGADGLYFSAPTDSAFDKLCKALRLVETNTCYYTTL